MIISTISLSKIASQMWSEHPFSQNKTRNKATKGAVGSRVGSFSKGGRGWTKLEKREE